MIDAQTYALERAICDKAYAYWKAHASYDRSGASSMSVELCAHPDYAACDNAMRGRVEQYELLTNTPDRFVAYIGTAENHGNDLERARGYTLGGDPTKRHAVTTWTGDRLGIAFLGRGWCVQSWIGSRMYQAHARINGRDFTGRTFGEGMCVNLRETAASIARRKRA